MREKTPPTEREEPPAGSLNKLADKLEGDAQMASAERSAGEGKPPLDEQVQAAHGALTELVNDMAETIGDERTILLLTRQLGRLGAAVGTERPNLLGSLFGKRGG